MELLAEWVAGADIRFMMSARFAAANLFCASSRLRRFANLQASKNRGLRQPAAKEWLTGVRKYLKVTIFSDDGKH